MPSKLKPVGILHFAIGVGDLDVGRKFYEEVLGCTYLRQNDTTVFMQAGSQYFVLTNTRHHRAPNPPGEYEFHHAFIVEGKDFDAALKSVADQGYPILIYEEEGHRTFTGRHAYIHDPYGNAIEIIDFHGIGDFSRPDFQGRQRRQAMKKGKPGKKPEKKPEKKKAAAKAVKKTAKKAVRTAPKKAAKKTAAKKKAAAKKPVLKTAARPKSAARRPARRPPRPQRRR